ncbi:MAG: DUF4124 domain-containing protein [Archangium sp.]
MRLFLLASVVISGSALAQQQGVWTGYVNGWQPASSSHYDPSRTFPRTYPVVRVTPQQQQWWAWQQSQIFLQQQYSQEQAKRQAEETARAEAAAQVALQAELAREQQRAADAQAALAQQQWNAQQEQLKLQQQLLEQERERTETARRALQEEEQQRACQRDAEKKVEAEREELRRALARAEEDAKPREKGPDIYKWVDEEGVTHISTRPREQR